MKKLLAFLLSAIAVMSLAACGQSPEYASETAPDSTKAPVSDTQEVSSPAENTTENLPENTSAFDFETKTVLLNNGIKMPILGIGTYRLSIEEAENSVYWALRDGYRLIDTAQMYRNETGVGRGIQRAIDEGFVTREEIFVTTKIWISDYPNADAAVNRSIQSLGLDYIDLMILHFSPPPMMWTPTMLWKAQCVTVESAASVFPIIMNQRISTALSLKRVFVP